MRDSVSGVVIFVAFLVFCGFGLRLNHEKKLAEALTAQRCAVSAPSTLTTQ